MSWRLARSLVVLRDEINTLAPHRNKEYDGTIGDEAHQRRQSDHNPNAAGVVCAFDATHDPGGGADMGVISEMVVRSGHPALKYVIFSRRIWTPDEGWHGYTGDNPHHTHMHVSVTGDYDNTSSWLHPGSGQPESEKAHVVYRLTSPYMRGEGIKRIQEALGIKVDGIYGPVTEQAVREYQEDHDLMVDGVAGPQTKKALGVNDGMV